MAKEKTEFVYKSVKELIPYARNARTHSDEQVAQIASSIKEFGFINPVLVSADNGIIAGHGRVLAAQKLGLDKVPCIVENHLTEAQRRAYILADNRLAEKSGWDTELLRIELDDLRSIDFDLDSLGFSLEEVDSLFSESLAIYDEPSDKSNSLSRSQERPGDFKDVEPKRLDHRCPRCGFEFNE